jgi:hypothetical protein
LQCGDHRGVADLTDATVREMRLFLAGTCEDVMRWLPPPQWEPAWQSEAARECWNGENGPSGAWDIRRSASRETGEPRHVL